MKILLTGANGFVGARIMAAMPVTAAPSLRDFTQDDVKRMIDDARPDVIIHTAAMSDIGACAAAPEASYHANVRIPEYIARAAGGAKIVMFSSDQVYSGCRGEGPYREEETAPANLYAREKLEMEQRVLDIDPNAVMLRATWMYDMPLYGHANRGNFIVNMLRAALTRQGMRCSRTEYRGITYVREVAALMKRAIALPGGAYNYGSENTLTMLETARVLADALKADVTLEPFDGGHNLWMDTSKLRAQGAAFSSTADGLMACLRDYGLIAGA